MSGSDVLSIPHYDPSERKFYIERWQDCEDIVEHNKKLQTQEQHGDAFHHVGTIPNAIIEKWLREEWDRGNVSLKWSSEEFDKLVAKKLRDPDWRWLRTDK